MNTQRDLLEACKDFSRHCTEFNGLANVTPEAGQAFLGMLLFPSGLRLPFCFVGEQALRANTAPTNNLTVIFSGAVARGSVRPTFHRISWFEKFSGNCLYLADPVLDTHPEIELGWYIGAPGWNLMEEIATTITHFQQALKTKDTYIYGSSGGGYAALSLARKMSGLRIISINPQIYLESWTPSVLHLFSSTVFNDDRESFIKKYPELNDVTLGLDDLANGNRILIYQNTTDNWKDGNSEKLISNRPSLIKSGAVRIESFHRNINHAAEKYEWVGDIFGYVENWNNSTLCHTEI